MTDDKRHVEDEDNNTNDSESGVILLNARVEGIGLNMIQ